MGVAFERNLRQPPPRRIDIYTQMTILFSGLVQQMGWVFLGFGMIFTAVFLPHSDWKYAFVFGPWEEVDGVVVAEDATNSSVNDQLVWKYTFKYSMNGKEYVGESYSTSGFSEGEKVRVKASTRKPWKAKIEGTTSGAFPKFIIVVLIFPLAGLLLMLPGIIHQAKALDLLRNGEFTRGRLREKTETNTTITINNVKYPVYKYVFGFQHGDKHYEAVCKTHVTEPLEDEEQETILFYPNHPSFNTVYDGISSSPHMDQMGNFITASWKKAWVFIAPAFAIWVTALGLKFLFVF